MPPKSRISREQIVEQGLELVRQGGEGALNARGLAAALGCSTQPIFSHFHSMEELKAAVVAATGQVYAQTVERVLATGEYPAYKATGMAYIRFAAEERELFRLLYMRDRTDEVPAGEETLEPLYRLLQEQCAIDRDTARLLHLEMWSVVHGIATMVVTGYHPVDPELASRMLTDVFTALCRRFSEKE